MESDGEREAEGEDEIDFLTVADVTTLHGKLIDQFSPGGSKRVRDAGLLESAVMNPQATWGGEYLYTTPAAMAGAYLYGLALNHPFEDGNKRIAFGTVAFFLGINGYRLTLTQDEAVELTLNVVNRVWDQEEATAVIEAGMEVL